jgi:hypothetical protein
VSITYFNKNNIRVGQQGMNINRAENGHIKLWRCINDSDLAEDNNAFMVFIRMVGFAHWQDDFTSIRFEGKQYHLKRGEFSATIAELAALTNLSVGTLRKVLDRLKESKRIEARSDNQKTIFRICNYAKYQDKPANERANEVANDRANERANVTEGKKKLKNIKNIDTKVSMAKTPRADIDEMFQEWEAITGMEISGQVTKNRYACSNLLKKHGKDKLVQLIRGVAMAQSEQYAPRISDFVSLSYKQNDLIAWGKSKQTSNQRKVVRI